MHHDCLDFSEAPKKIKYYIVIEHNNKEYVSIVKQDYEYVVKELKSKLAGSATDSFTIECEVIKGVRPITNDTVIFRKTILDNSIITIKYLD